ncbi:MAG TPA: DUF1326 domain-containing protein [Gaiellaceae bacterium]|nr:DUF1326 domain-containing protein [Gaiellaceae bacterium]
MSWRIAGAYFESCNCAAICPCRMIGTVPGGRSTYGICYGALGWRIDEGHAESVDLSGLAASLTIRYDDDERGSPWDIVLHVDARGDLVQRAALEQVFLGELGGDVLRLPWVRKPRNLIDVRTSMIRLEDGPDGHLLRVGESVSLTATRPVETDLPVTCGIPGYHQPGTELYADSFTVDDAPFEWELEGNCAFASAFLYSS